MRQLRHFSHSPFCRKVRLVLGEKKLAVELVPLRPWEHNVSLPFLPELVEAPGVILSDSRAIAEYLDETGKGPALMPATPLERALARRWINRFDDCVWADVSAIVLRERVLKRYTDAADRQPDLAGIKAAQLKLRDHLEAVEKALGRHGYFTSSLSLADLTAAAHLSCLDFFGDVPWRLFPGVKEWYAGIKSRPSFRPLLADQLTGFPPSAHYADLDF